LNFDSSKESKAKSQQLKANSHFDDFYGGGARKEFVTIV
jgi:hypothetical protein